VLSKVFSSDQNPGPVARGSSTQTAEYLQEPRPEHRNTSVRGGAMQPGEEEEDPQERPQCRMQ
jgi:hypothetical protein